MSKKAGKGDKPRPKNWAKWDACPLWDNIGKNKKKTPSGGKNEREQEQ